MTQGTAPVAGDRDCVPTQPPTAFDRWSSMLDVLSGAPPKTLEPLNPCHGRPRTSLDVSPSAWAVIDAQIDMLLGDLRRRRVASLGKRPGGRCKG